MDLSIIQYFNFLKILIYWNNFEIYINMFKMPPMISVLITIINKTIIRRRRFGHIIINHFIFIKN